MRVLTGAFVLVAGVAGLLSFSGWWPEGGELANGVMLVATAAAFVTFMQLASEGPTVRLP